MRISILILLLAAMNIVHGQCSSAGPNNGGTFSNNTAVGTVAWTNTSNAQISDNIYSANNISLSVLSTATSNYLLVTNFGFSISSFASICGIKVEVEKKYNVVVGLLSGITDHSIRLVKGGIISGNNNSTGSGWTTTNTYSIYGSSADSWGLSWTPADINASNFGVAISFSASSGLAALTMDGLVDHIRITVYYNIPVPVHFKEFNAMQEQDKVKLQWSTASESNSSYFVAERMTGAGSGWTAIDSVPAAFNSNEEKVYELNDLSPAETNMYRIREVDIDNRSIYSKTVNVSYRSSTVTVKIFPNPAGQDLSVSSTYHILSARLIDMTGNQVVSLIPDGSQYRTDIRVSKLSNGIYYLFVETMKGRSVQKVVILH